MSNIGKQILALSDNIQVFELNNNISNTNIYFLKSKLGMFEFPNSDFFNLVIDRKNKRLAIQIKPKYVNYPKINSFWGTYVSLFKKMLHNLSTGVSIQLEFVGLGYKAIIENDNLILKIGTSHEIKYLIPKNMTAKLINPTLLTLKGINDKDINEFSVMLSNLKKPDVYKGKGIHIPGTYYIRKEGKKQK